MLFFRYCLFLLALTVLPLSSQVFATASSPSSTKLKQLSPTPEDPSSVTPTPATTTPATEPASIPLSIVDTFAPLSIVLQPKLEALPLPSWTIAPVKVDPSNASVEFILPPIPDSSEITSFVLTVNFYDTGLGEPFVQLKTDTTSKMLYSGQSVKGAALNPHGTPLPRNSTTLLISNDIVGDNGVPMNPVRNGCSLLITHAGHFEKLISLTIRPAHAPTSEIAILGEGNHPAIIEETATTVQKDVAAGTPATIKQGDAVHNRIFNAELYAAYLHENEVEFNIPLQGLPEATRIHTELLGLDLDSYVEVELNGVPVDRLHTADFTLDAPQLITTGVANDQSSTSVFHYAGWRNGWLYIPGSLWKEGNNTLVFFIRQRPGSTEGPSTPFFRNTRLDLRYTTTPTITPNAGKGLFRF